ncbi:PREDICTED: uncharacterized protein LOC109226067 [Nicotiana attenuata]|uniref:uncharacterized protein LOC109226067 n=1 Tax=Nicotiana attenuata TaxID=49451 RepID=UPI000904C97E|nr:PREDICTED: uncharacterized protein LOC109226067 [Nicotiana attenuata]
MAGNEATSLEHNHPLFLQAADAPCLVLVPIKLTGPENYALGELVAQWEKCDAIVLSWIGSTVSNELMPSIVFAPTARKVWSDLKEKFDRCSLTRIYHLWSEIASLKQGTDSVTTYYTKMSDLWSELDVLVPLPSCDCEESRPSVEHLRNQRLLTFLMGLNESYNNVRSNVLLKRTFVIVNEAYAIVTQEESQRTLGGNLKENCYKIVGYPADFKSKKKPQTGGNRSFVNAARTEETGGTSNQPQGHFLTEEQYQQLIGLLNKQGGEECSTNMAGIMTLLSNIPLTSWIVDSGATHHVAHDKRIMSDIKQFEGHGVQLPTGNKAEITYTGKATILGGKCIKDVLHVPDFKFNLLSVAKHTRDLTYTVKFFPDFCMLQGLYNGKVLGIGRESDGLYILKEYAQAAGITVGAAKNGIIHESSCPYTLQQNGIVERRHRHILDVARALKFHSGVPLKFWGECVRTAVYLINRLPTPVLQGRTPYVMLYGKFVTLDHLRVFGCQSFACNLPKGDKFSPRARRAVFIRYSETQKGYRLYDLDNHVVFVSRDVKFQEYVFPFKQTSNNHDEEAFEGQDTLPQVEQPASQIEEPAPQNDMLINSPSSTTIPPPAPIVENSRSHKQTKKPLWLKDYVTTKLPGKYIYPMSNHLSYTQLSTAYQTYLQAFSTSVEPTSYKETTADPDWVLAMQQEIQALEDNHTWEIVNLPPDKQAIRSKWVYKIKYKANGEVERFKARLVAKG